MKLAILIVGKQNSGKTSTIKHLINKHCDKSLSIMRAGWQYPFLISTFKSLRLNVFCIPASPTETGIELRDRFKDWDYIPQVLILAEQSIPSKYPSTISYLTANGYTIIQYNILDTNGAMDWERFTSKNETIKLDSRVNQIVNDIKTFIKTNGII